MLSCPNCGGKLIGDGYHTPVTCEFADLDLERPVDSEPLLCTPLPDRMPDGVYKIGRKNNWHTLALVTNGVVQCPGLTCADFHTMPVMDAFQLIISRKLVIDRLPNQ